MCYNLPMPEYNLWVLDKFRLCRLCFVRVNTGSFSSVMKIESHRMYMSKRTKTRQSFGWIRSSLRQIMDSRLTS